MKRIFYEFFGVPTACIFVMSSNVYAQGPLKVEDQNRFEPVELRKSIDRNSASFIDFRSRLRDSIRSNSIAGLMLIDSLKGDDPGGSNMVGILQDHRDGVSAAESFRGGKHTFTGSGSLAGGLRTSELVQTFTGAEANLTGRFDLTVLREGRELIPTDGRIQEQTGVDYLVGGGSISTIACGSVSGNVAASVIGGAAVGSISADGKLCYQYNPSSMTALASYVARNQSRLNALEAGQAEDFEFLAEELFLHFSSNCGILVERDPAGPCGPIADHLKI